MGCSILNPQSSIENPLTHPRRPGDDRADLPFLRDLPGGCGHLLLPQLSPLAPRQARGGAPALPI